MPKLFSKSTFKTALHCPWKLNYLNSPEFDNSALEDPFLKSLAEGGFQVGELAKIYEGVKPEYDLDKAENLGGKFLDQYNRRKAAEAKKEPFDEEPLVPTNQDYIARTKELLAAHDEICIAEAAFRWGNCFVRADILKKKGNEIELIEVKAKSYDSTVDHPLVPDSTAKFAGRHKVHTDLRMYIYDVAFQKYVISHAVQGCTVHAYLMMADKSREADVNGLNQLFKIEQAYTTRFGKEQKMSQARMTPDATAILADSKVQVLSRMDVDEACDMIIAGKTTEQVNNAEVYRCDALYAKACKEYDEKLATYLEKSAAGNNRVREPKKPVKKGLPDELPYNPWMDNRPFKEFVQKASAAYCAGEEYPGDPHLCGECFKCEFTSDAPERDGKRACWLSVLKGAAAAFDCKPRIEILNGGALGGKRGEWVEQGIYYMDQLTSDQLKEFAGADPDKGKKGHASFGDISGGLDLYQRKWLQIALETDNLAILPPSIRKNITGHTYLDAEGLREEMKNWRFPLHMIDFETTAVALPYYEGMKPYEQVAFQFSHHVIRRAADGSYSIEHAGQYLNPKVSAFPNFDFLRALKEQLSADEGTIFRYANHENSILCAIAEQLKASSEPDKDDLIKFIRKITHNDKADNGQGYCGPRDMVDLLEVVKRYFFQLDEMHGSNSIKQVLPAVLNSSAFLREKYSRPIYGTAAIPSLNFSPAQPKAWIELNAEGKVESPYHLLESIGDLLGLTPEQIAELERQEQDEGEFEVANGGAALTAYAKLMFVNDFKMEDALRTALLRYCELDTMSMVFIWEYFNKACFC